MSSFPMPVNLLANLEQFKKDVDEAKAYYLQMKGEVEGAPVSIGTGGGGSPQGSGVRPPMVVQPPRFAYQGGPHSSSNPAISSNPMLKNPIFASAVQGALGTNPGALHPNQVNQTQLANLARQVNLTPGQLQAAYQGGGHSSPTPGRSTSSGGPSGNPLPGGETVWAGQAARGSYYSTRSFQPATPPMIRNTSSGGEPEWMTQSAVASQYVDRSARQRAVETVTRSAQPAGRGMAGFNWGGMGMGGGRNNGAYLGMGSGNSGGGGGDGGGGINWAGAGMGMDGGGGGGRFANSSPDSIGPPMANGRFVSNTREGGQSWGQRGFAATLARRAVSALIIYGIAKELSSSANWATASAMAGGDVGAQAKAYSDYTKGVAPFGTGSFLTMGLDVSLGQTQRQGELAGTLFNRGTALYGSQLGNAALASGPNSAARSLAQVERGRRLANQGLVGQGIPGEQMQNEKIRDWTFGSGWISATGGGANMGRGESYDEGAYAQNQATYQNFRRTQNQQRDANNEEARLNARDIKIQMDYETKGMEASNYASNMGNRFRPVAGKAGQLSMLAKAEQARYDQISNPSDLDYQRHMAILGGFAAGAGGLERDINARIMGGAPVGFSAYRSALEYRDPTQEDLGSAQTEANQTLMEILMLLQNLSLGRP